MPADGPRPRRRGGSLEGGILERSADAGARLRLEFDGSKRIDAREGDSVSLALLDAGVLATSRSAKYRRPRGPYCLRGDCGTCLVRIDGQPNRRACLTMARASMRVMSQNKLVKAGPDPTALVDRVLRGGMDHHHFMVRPRILNKAMQGIARGLTGLGTLPDAVPDQPSQHVESSPDVLLVGAGPAGRAAAEVLRAAGREVEWFERRPAAAMGLPELPDPAPRFESGVFGVYPHEGLVAAMTEHRRRPPTLHTIRPRHIVVATGSRDPTIPLVGNDLPGVVAGRGLLAQLAAGRAWLPQGEALVVGEGPIAQRLARRLAAPQVAPDDVEKVAGGKHVEKVHTRKGKHAVSLVVLAPLPAPAFELARQAGAQVRWADGGFAVVRDEHGRGATTGPWTLWITGDVAGLQRPAPGDALEDAPAAGDDPARPLWPAQDEAAASDGRRVARRLLEEGG